MDPRLRGTGPADDDLFTGALSAAAATPGSNAPIIDPRLRGAGKELGLGILPDDLLPEDRSASTACGAMRSTEWKEVAEASLAMGASAGHETQKSCNTRGRKARERHGNAASSRFWDARKNPECV